jgi:hypothetical protein
MQDALNSIMDLCESKMNENDYLIVTGELKKIYDENKKKQQTNRRIVKANRILNRDELQTLAGTKITFQLSQEEQIMIMDSRWKQYYANMESAIREEMEEVTIQLRETTEEKKDAWTYVNQWRHSNSVNRENSLYEHKELVQREKVLKLRLKELRRELATVRR